MSNDENTKSVRVLMAEVVTELKLIRSDREKHWELSQEHSKAIETLLIDNGINKNEHRWMKPAMWGIYGIFGATILSYVLIEVFKNFTKGGG